MSEAKVCTDTGDFCCLAELEAEFTPDTVFSLGSMFTVHILFKHHLHVCCRSVPGGPLQGRQRGGTLAHGDVHCHQVRPRAARHVQTGAHTGHVTRGCIMTRDTWQDQSWDYTFLSTSDTVFTKLALSATFSPGAGVYPEVCPDIYTTHIYTYLHISTHICIISLPRFCLTM